MQAFTLVTVLLSLAHGLCEGTRFPRAAGGVGTFWHVSDFHLDFYYDDNQMDRTKVCPSSNGVEATNPGIWGDYRCDSPWTLINSSVYAMKRFESDPDFILWTGDDTLHTNDEEKYLGTDNVIATIRNITELLKSVFPNTVVHSSLGNHDYHPKNQFPAGPNQIVSSVAEMWSSWMTSEQVKMFNETGRFIVNPPEFPNLNIISLNTPLWYTSNKLMTGVVDPGGQFQWMEEALLKSRNDNKKVYLIGHIPPGYFELVDYKPWYHKSYNTRFNNIIRDYSDVIVGQFFGHHHTDTFRMFYKEGSPVSTLWITPGVTPWMTTLPGAVNGANNPGIRLFKFDKQTLEPLDYTQYMLDLTKANADGSDDWVVEYSAKEAFQIPDLSPASFDAFLGRLGSSQSTECSSSPASCQGDDAMQQFALLNSVSYNEAHCDTTCQVNHVCSIAEVDYDAYLDCVESGAHRPGFGVALNVALVALAAMVAVFGAL